MWRWFGKQELFLKSAACFAIVGLLWFWEQFEAAASYRSGEKDFGVGILALLAAVASLFFVPAALAFLGFGFAKLRYERRIKRDASADQS